MKGVGRAALITAGAAATTIVVDRALKVAVEHGLDEGQRTRGPLGIAIVRRNNDTGIAGIGSDGETNVPLLAAGGLLALGIAGAGALLARPTLLQVGAGMTAGGMTANLVDRATGGGVTDFVPTSLGVLNAADVAIGAGIVLAGLGMVLR